MWLNVKRRHLLGYQRNWDTQCCNLLQHCIVLANVGDFHLKESIEDFLGCSSTCHVPQLNLCASVIFIGLPSRIIHGKLWPNLHSKHISSTLRTLRVDMFIAYQLSVSSLVVVKRGVQDKWNGPSRNICIGLSTRFGQRYLMPHNRIGIEPSWLSLCRTRRRRSRSHSEYIYEASRLYSSST